MASISMNAEVKAADSTPISFLREVVQAPSPLGRIKSAILKHKLSHGTPPAPVEQKAPEKANTTDAASAPVSEAESVFVMRTGAAEFAVEPTGDLTKTRLEADAYLQSEPDQDGPSLPEMSILQDGPQILRLDASWQILPTADFATEGPGARLHMVV